MVGEILGIFTGVYMIATFIRFIIRRVFKKESFGATCISVAISMFAYMSIPLLIASGNNYIDSNAFLSFILAPFCAILVCYLFTTKFTFKRWIQNLLFGLILYAIICFPLLFALNSLRIIYSGWLVEFVLFVSMVVILYNNRDDEIIEIFRKKVKV